MLERERSKSGEMREKMIRQSRWDVVGWQQNKERQIKARGVTLEKKEEDFYSQKLKVDTVHR